MALSNDDLAQIKDLLAAPEAEAEIIALVRSRFPGLSITRCDASDIDGEQAVWESPRADLHLVDGNDHCWKLTTDLARATGIVVVFHKN